ncbi:transcription elongation factor GreAB [Pseudoalteromonas sp. McH1-7]|uniref:transcription elongation factor GreAB n=1 Tax=unclassified Pseudoalteromonas TaxID=194690 RepID=UPI000F6471FF|nr:MULTISPECIES: transcription elongation factor GreAB [unclassified Pseudoalteromonas]NUZ09494.1 transcription elongation factor GreAB [Pseudoalteromonas sp. McH1-7]RRS07122.1 transcription elongation factor GreAB [Pseudoalteromonas sp. J010]RXF06235.1 transcription elongation factor GreAB [Pseudoalteromonas sp. PS5]USD29712.1 transcription elongation factor GreAB [Pseudoalteromonas sp. SCSIO 43201]
MIKTVFIEYLKFALEQKLIEATAAANSARADATHEQSAAETQYDSLSIEYGYLAEGQSERVDAMYLAKQQILNQVSNPVSNTITYNALVAIDDEQGDRHWFYFAPSEGGLKIQYKETPVLVITFDAPLAKRLQGLTIDDDISFLFNGQEQTLTVSQIL